MPAPVPRTVRIHYRRPPDRRQVFRQTLVHDGATVLVTYLPEAGVPRPVTVADRIVLEADSPAVWFTFPGEHHDIGRFHTPAGELTGYYANVLTPVEFLPRAEDGTDVWRTTDLFLDLFLTPDGVIHELDHEELQDAVERGWVDPETARTARAELQRLAQRANSGAWPPPVVEEWTLERARRVAASRS